MKTTTASSADCVKNTTVLSNKIIIHVNTTVAPAISIAAAANLVCQGDPVSFTAAVTNAGAHPVYQWRVNGVSAGLNDPVYTGQFLQNGDRIDCILSSDASCAAVMSNTIVLKVNPLPVIANQVFTAMPGLGISLQPVISGNIVHYLWTPATGLSNDTIRQPLANPAPTTVYHLRVTTEEGCLATAGITVKVFTDIHIPNAFTPNGDGHNDVFYVLGGPAGAVIKDFMVFGRWGETIFQVHQVPPGDPAFGWNGLSKGNTAPAGTYVYRLNLQLAGGMLQTFKGIVILLR